MARVGIDLDGVCYDFAGSLEAFLRQGRELPRDFFPPPTRWEFYEDWGMTTGEFIEVCNAGVEAGVIFTYGDPHPGTQAAFRHIKEAGHTIHIVTDRSFGKPGASEDATMAWLDKYGLEYNTLTFTNDKTSVSLDYMVDDKPENYHALRLAGVNVWLFDRPWNHNILGARRVYSLLQYVGVVSA